MKLEATIKQVIEDGDQLSITVRGWSDADPIGTMPRPLGIINVPSNVRNQRAYHIGRRLFIDVRPA
jgi:hypothetical protein